MLTNQYIAFMEAAYNHVRSVPKERLAMQTMVDNFKEHFIVNINAGRQSGKSTAVVKFAAQCMLDGDHVIVISHDNDSASELVRMARREAYTQIERRVQSIPGCIYDGGSYRSLFVPTRSGFYNLVKRPVVFVDEPMHFNANKFSEVMTDYFGILSANPVVFVMGMQ